MVRGATDLDQLLSGLRALAGEAAAPRLVGVGWATVDIERTMEGLAGVDVRPADSDELLGARAWCATLGPVALLLLEPITEGRLAAALARRGEGIAALYLAADGRLDGSSGGTPDGTPEGAPRPTALGVPGRLMPQEGPWGPFIIRISPTVPGAPSTPGRAARRT